MESRRDAIVGAMSDDDLARAAAGLRAEHKFKHAEALEKFAALRCQKWHSRRENRRVRRTVVRKEYDPWLDLET